MSKNVIFTKFGAGLKKRCFGRRQKKRKNRTFTLWRRFGVRLLTEFRLQASGGCEQIHCPDIERRMKILREKVINASCHQQQSRSWKPLICFSVTFRITSYEFWCNYFDIKSLKTINFVQQTFDVIASEFVWCNMKYHSKVNQTTCFNNLSKQSATSSPLNFIGALKEFRHNRCCEGFEARLQNQNISSSTLLTHF